MMIFRNKKGAAWEPCRSTVRKFLNHAWMQRLSVSVLLGGILVGCSDQAEVPSDVVAEVNDVMIDSARFEREWDKRARGSATVAEREQVLDRLVERSALAQRAIELGLGEDPVVLETLESILVSRLKETVLFPQIEAIEISEADARSYYSNYYDERYTRPEVRQVAVLWYDTRGKEPLELRYRKRLERVVADLEKTVPNASEGFGSLAINNSEHAASRYKGGIVTIQSDQIGAGAWHRQVASLASDLQEPGELSSVVTTDAGVFLVRLVSVQPTVVQGFESAHANIVRILKRERREAMEQAFEESILAKVHVERYPSHLSQLSLPTTTSKSELPHFLQFSSND